MVLYRLRLQRSPLAALEGIRRAAQGAGQAPPTADDSERWLRAYLGNVGFAAGTPLALATTSTLTLIPTPTLTQTPTLIPTSTRTRTPTLTLTPPPTL